MVQNIVIYMSFVSDYRIFCTFKPVVMSCRNLRPQHVTPFLFGCLYWFDFSLFYLHIVNVISIISFLT